MPIPSQKDIQIPLLHIIHNMGGKVKPNDVFGKIADYFRLTKKEQQEMQPSGVSKKFDNRVAWARNSLCVLGFLDRNVHGIWQITEKGRMELTRLGLINKPFPVTTSSQDPVSGDLSFTNIQKEEHSDDEALLELVLDEIAPAGPRQFPDDFIDKHCHDFYELELTGTQLHFAPFSQTIITSPKGYFRYQTKNPSEAKYILYTHNVGSKNVKVPKDNFTLFKTVKNYEKYCDEVTRKAFELFLEFTYDEVKAEELTGEAVKRLGLKTSIVNSKK